MALFSNFFKSLFFSKLELIVLLIIIVVSAFLRFYDLQNRYVFTLDEEYQATYAQTIADDFHIVWIGVSASQLDFYLGPFWTYLTAFLLYISGGDPLFTGYFAALIGVATTVLIYFTGNILYGRSVGVIAGFLYATLPLYVFFDQKYWNPTLIPFLSVLILLALYKSFQNPKWWIILAGSFGLILHTHLSLVPLTFYPIYLVLFNKTRLNKRIIVMCIVVLLIILSPLIAFDYFHDYSNITAPLRVFDLVKKEQSNQSVTPINRAQAMFYSFGRIWFLKPFSTSSDEVLYGCSANSIFGSTKVLQEYSTQTKPHILLSVITVLMLGIFLIYKKTWQNLNTRILAILISSVLGSFLLFPGSGIEYYILGSLTLLVFIPAILISYLPRLLSLFSVVILMIFMFLGIFTVMNATNDYGIRTQKILIEKVTESIGNNSFDLTEAGLCHKRAGWRYLFKVYGRTPNFTTTDVNLGWLYPNEIKPGKTTYSVIVAEERVPIEQDLSGVLKISQGGFSAYIIKND